jgi:hypothetical protein
MVLFYHHGYTLIPSTQFPIADATMTTGAAEREQISVERVVYSALAEQLKALDRLEERAARSSEDKFRAALAKIPDVEPADFDRL